MEVPEPWQSGTVLLLFSLPASQSWALPLKKLGQVKLSAVRGSAPRKRSPARCTEGKLW